MQGSKSILTELNAVLKIQLTNINQYFLHARMYRNWGYHELNERDYKASIRAMKDADRTIQRVLFLEGLPNLQSLGKLLVGEDVQEMLDCDLKSEHAYRDAMVKALEKCEEKQDYISRDMLKNFLEDAEEYIDDIETDIDLIGKIGLKNYLQSKAGEDD